MVLKSLISWVICFRDRMNKYFKDLSTKKI